MLTRSLSVLLFFFNDTATTEIYTLSLHDALPLSTTPCRSAAIPPVPNVESRLPFVRSEEHTSELQSQSNLVCRLLLETKKNKSGLSPRIWSAIGGKDDHKHGKHH